MMIMFRAHVDKLYVNIMRNDFIRPNQNQINDRPISWSGPIAPIMSL